MKLGLINAWTLFNELKWIELKDYITSVAKFLLETSN